MTRRQTAARFFTNKYYATPPASRLIPPVRPAALALGILAQLAPLSGPTLAQAAPTASAKTSVDRPALGRLQLENGYPTAATARKLYDELDLQRATQAYLWALPAVGYKALYDAQAKTMGVRNGDVLLYRTLQDKAGMLTPNITTLYAFSFWDLAKQGPLVVEVPAGLTAGGVLDIWQQPITDLGQTGPDKGAGGKYLILPPGGPEVVAPGYRIFRSPSNQVWFGTRGLAPDKAVAEATVRQHRLYGWNQRANPPATGYSEVGGRPWQSAQPTDLSYWRLLSDLYANEPVASRDRMMFGMLSPLGIAPGQAFKPDARQAPRCTPASTGSTPCCLIWIRNHPTSAACRSTSAAPGSTRRSACRWGCRAGWWASARCIWRPLRTPRASGSTAAAATACACRPMRR